MEIALGEVSAADLVDPGQTAEKIAFAHERHENDAARFFLPFVALSLIELFQHAVPPGAFVPPYPATDADVHGQGLAHDLVRVFPAPGPVGVLSPISVQYRPP